jgi:hypothetical protein
MGAIMKGILGTGTIVGVAGYLISSFLQVGRTLDPVFVTRGLTSGVYLASGRQCRGLVEGRLVSSEMTGL